MAGAGAGSNLIHHLGQLSTFGIAPNGTRAQGTLALVLIPLDMDPKLAVSPNCQMLILAKTHSMEEEPSQSQDLINSPILFEPRGSKKNIVKSPSKKEPPSQSQDLIVTSSPLEPRGAKKTIAKTPSMAEVVEIEEPSQDLISSPSLLEPRGFQKKIAPASKFVAPRPVKETVKRQIDFESTAEILAGFDKVEEKENDEYNYGKPVRKNADKKKMKGWDCPECQKFYEGLESQMHPSELQRLKDKCSKHRSKVQRMNLTPTDFWSTSMPSTEEAYAKGLIQIGVASPSKPKKRYDLLENDN